MLSRVIHLRSSTALGLIIAAASAFGCGTGQAQEVPQRGASGPADGAVTQLEDIIVTANKRAENLQDVPIAITAVTGARLEAIGITSTQDIAAVVPGLTIQQSVGGTQAHIRGVGTTTLGPGTENSIATYVDNVYMFSMSGALVQLNSIDQIEVLKGPQGTLFGRNATGGVINIRTRDPKHEPSGQFSLGYGNYETFSGKGYLTGGITENLAADIAGFVSLQGKGWGKNLFNGRDANKLDQYAVRSKWMFEPGDRDKFRLVVDYSELRGNQLIAGPIIGKTSNYGPGGALAVQRPDLAPYVASGALFPFAEVGEPYTYAGGYYDTVATRQPHLVFKSEGASLQWDHDFGSVRFASITAYREAKQDTNWPVSPLPAFRNEIEYSRKEKQFSQELQLGSSAESDIQWVVGLYYLDTKAGFYPATLTGTALAPLQSLQFVTEVTGQSGAAFGQVTAPLWEGAHLTGGLRYTVEERGQSGSITTTFLPVLPPFLPSILAGSSSTTVVPELQKTFRKLTWRLALDQQLTPDILAYASYNRGFKSGTFNALPPGAPPAAPEILDAFEAGLKTDLLERRVRFNISAFYYKYKNIQVTVTTPISTALQNGAGAEVYGVDMDLTARIGSHLTVFGGLAVLDHEFTAYPGAGFFVAQPASVGGGAVKVVGNAKGNKLPYASDTSFNVGATYTAPIGEGAAEFNVNYAYQTRWYAGPDNLLSQPGYGLLDASARYRLPGDRISIGVWARNIADEQYATYLAAVENPGGQESQAVGAPRTFGVNVEYEF